MKAGNGGQASSPESPLRGEAAMNGNRFMDRFRLLRSKAFWFGVPGLVGLLWGWWVSMGHLSVASYGSGRNEWMIGQSAGELVMGWNWDGGHSRQVKPQHTD